MSYNINYTQPLEKVLENLQKLTALASPYVDDALLIDLPAQYFTPWEAGLRLETGMIISSAGVKYKVLEPTITHSLYPPYQQNMRSTYKPFQGMHGFRWVYGETIKAGMTREAENYNEKPYIDENNQEHYPTAMYTALADIESSTTNPSQDVANWSIKEVDPDA